jgi:hypothetical protein
MKERMCKEVVLAGMLALAAGCTNMSPYREVDLSADLPAHTLQRYERLAESGAEDGEASKLHCADGQVLEYSNWWPLGLLLYYHRGSVMRMMTPEGAVYHVSSGKGYGPLSLLYSLGAHATYNASGERLSGMTTGTLLLGHLAMFHESDALLADNSTERMSSSHWLHHILNFHSMNDHRYFSLFTYPNALGADIKQ